MKRNISIIVGIVVILVIIVLLQKKSTPESMVANPTVQPTTQGTVTSTTNSAPTPKPGTSLVTPKPNTNTSYTNYVTNVSVAENSCDASAKAQFTSQYNALESASYSSYYNQTTGGCYSKVTGKSRAAYATSTAALMIFRDVRKNTNLAECVDTRGITLANDEWTCTDKTTGATITVPAFNGLIYKYAAK